MRCSRGVGNRFGGLALDDGAVYWTSNIDGEGPPPPPDDKHFLSFHNLVVAGDSVYFDEDGTTLYRVCK